MVFFSNSYHFILCFPSTFCQQHGTKAIILVSFQQVFSRKYFWTFAKVVRMEMLILHVSAQETVAWEWLIAQETFICALSFAISLSFNCLFIFRDSFTSSSNFIVCFTLSRQIRQIFVDEAARLAIFDGQKNKFHKSLNSNGKAINWVGNSRCFLALECNIRRKPVF